MAVVFQLSLLVIVIVDIHLCNSKCVNTTGEDYSDIDNNIYKSGPNERYTHYAGYHIKNRSSVI